jgi:hypothetical protein
MYMNVQAKEKLITMLKEGGGEGGGGASGVPTVSLAEVDGLRQEKEMLHEELQQARMTIDSLRTEIAVSLSDSTFMLRYSP